jgi:Flp pilus assembly protein TadB
VTIAVVLAFALASGTPLVVVGLVGLAALQPIWFLAAAGIWAAVAHRGVRRSLPSPDDEADALRGLVAELAAGASLRSAVDAASARAPGLGLDRAAARARAGLALERVADAMEGALPVNGRAVHAAMGMAAVTGAPAARVFAALADRAAEAGRLRRERRALTAQARLSAAIVGGIPLLLVVALVAGGRGPDLWAEPAGRLVLVTGGGLVGAGSALVGWMVRDR